MRTAAGLAQSAMDAVTDGRVQDRSRRATPRAISTGSARSATGPSAASFGGDIGFRSGHDADREREPDTRQRAFRTAANDRRRWQSIDDGATTAHGSIVRTTVTIDLHRDDDESSPSRAKAYVQDPDVLDTWFSSALWPHSARSAGPSRRRSWTYYYPTSVLITSRDIITLWVARMVLTGLEQRRRRAVPRGLHSPQDSRRLRRDDVEVEGERRRSARRHRQVRRRLRCGSAWRT